MKTLIVEDIKMMGKLLENFFTPYGETKFAVNGKDAIVEYNLANMENEPFDLICLDIMLPVYSGYDILKSIRKLEKDNNIPDEKKVKIVMMTALDDKKHIREAINAGCDGYITKPFSREKVIAEIKRLGLIEA